MLRGQGVSSPFATAQGESIHLAPTDIKKIVAKAKKDDEKDSTGILSKAKKHMMSRLRLNRNQLPASQDLPSWLKCTVDTHKHILKLSGIPTLEGMEKDKDQVTFFLTITDNLDYVVKEFKLTVKHDRDEKDMDISKEETLASKRNTSSQTQNRQLTTSVSTSMDDLDSWH